MDNLFTKEYIEKCVNNPDLQSLWEFPLQTYYYHTEHKKVYLLVETNFEFKPKYIFWVPRQDELQLILKQKKDRFNNMTDLKFDFNMRKCVFTTYCHKILNFLTLNDMWLIFFMRELFGKQWVPESKAWQVR